ncbi:peptidase E [Seonamhaeicola sediminis]|uniref:Peptidase E n=1 Tax=Seonamhaeicola sediminis TaxID=2528206 RepID=A0A562YFS2_9FLAO|nr:peptidase E [Seonamhaeicola sediminis]
MYLSKTLLVLFIIPLFTLFSIHKYYISVTQIEYVQDKQSVQIITRVFLDDFENVLRERYDESITLDKTNGANVNLYIERYLNNKIKIKINGTAASFAFIGKEYDLDIMKCYLEIEGVESIESFEITNTVLFDMFEDQQNIIKTKINSKQKSFILVAQNDNAVLNFN